MHCGFSSGSGKICCILHYLGANEKYSRIIAGLQAIWFLVNLIARAAQHLTITTLELTTASFVIILFGTAWSWKEKPSDVTVAVPIKALVSIEDIVLHVGGFYFTKGFPPLLHT